MHFTCLKCLEWFAKRRRKIYDVGLVRLSTCLQHPSVESICAGFNGRGCVSRRNGPTQVNHLLVQLLILCQWRNEVKNVFKETEQHK